MILTVKHAILMEYVLNVTRTLPSNKGCVKYANPDTSMRIISVNLVRIKTVQSVVTVEMIALNANQLIFWMEMIVNLAIKIAKIALHKTIVFNV